jgi:hypothetical protein
VPASGTGGPQVEDIDSHVLTYWEGSRREKDQGVAIWGPVRVAIVLVTGRQKRNRVSGWFTKPSGTVPPLTRRPHFDRIPNLSRV